MFPSHDIVTGELFPSHGIVTGNLFPSHEVFPSHDNYGTKNETLRGRRRKTTHERVGSHEESTGEFGPNCEENTTETRELDEGPTSGSNRP